LGIVIAGLTLKSRGLNKPRLLKGSRFCFLW